MGVSAADGGAYLPAGGVSGDDNGMVRFRASQRRASGRDGEGGSGGGELGVGAAWRHRAGEGRRRGRALTNREPRRGAGEVGYNAGVLPPRRIGWKSSGLGGFGR